MNLVEGLLQANNASRKHLAELAETARALGHKSVDDDPGLRISKAATETLIRETKAAIASGDLLRMLRAAHMHGLGGSESVGGEDARGPT